MPRGRGLMAGTQVAHTQMAHTQMAQQQRRNGVPC